MPNSDHLQYASLSRRLAAYLIDLAIAFCVLLLVGFTIRIFQTVGLWEISAGGATPEEQWRSLGAIAKSAVLVAFFVTSGLLYFPVLEASRWQATFGKRLLGIHVTTDDGGRVGTGCAFGRWIAKWVLNWFALFLVSMITIVASKNRKALHDSMAGTVVLRGRPVPGGPIEPWRMVVALGVPYVWTLATMMATL